MNRVTKRALNKFGREFAALIIVVVIVLAAMSIAHGQEVITVSAPKNDVKKLEAASAPAGADVTWEIVAPADKDFLLSKDGRQLALFTEDHPRIIVVCDVIDWDARKRTKTKTVIVPGGPVPPIPPEPEPEPEPGPVPVPEGFAGEVLKEARKVNRPAEALLLGAVFENVASVIAAGGIRTLEAAQAELARQNDALNLNPLWRPFGDWITLQLNANAQSLADARTRFEEAATGLKVAGGGR